MQAIVLVALLSPIVFGSNSHSWQAGHPAILNPLRRTPHAGTPSFAFLGSATLAQNQALQARRE